MASARGPIPNSYQLCDGRLIAGEYPGEHGHPARAKLVALLDAGVRTFIDLTEPHELEPYDALLAEEAASRGVTATHVRLPIPDFSVPRSTDAMRDILDAIDAALENGGGAYVHCWGGVGRTATVIGCHLVRTGMPADAALARVAELFQVMEKYDPRRRSPETAEQEAYVRGWREPTADRDDEGERRMEA